MIHTCVDIVVLCTTEISDMKKNDPIRVVYFHFCFVKPLLFFDCIIFSLHEKKNKGNGRKVICHVMKYKMKMINKKLHGLHWMEKLETKFNMS